MAVTLYSDDYSFVSVARITVSCLCNCRSCRSTTTRPQSWCRSLPPQPRHWWGLQWWWGRWGGWHGGQYHPHTSAVVPLCPHMVLCSVINCCWFPDWLLTPNIANWTLIFMIHNIVSRVELRAKLEKFPIQILSWLFQLCITVYSQRSYLSAWSLWSCMNCSHRKKSRSCHVCAIASWIPTPSRTIWMSAWPRAHSSGRYLVRPTAHPLPTFSFSYTVARVQMRSRTITVQLHSKRRGRIATAPPLRRS